MQWTVPQLHLSTVLKDILTSNIHIYAIVPILITFPHEKIGLQVYDVVWQKMLNFIYTA